MKVKNKLLLCITIVLICMFIPTIVNAKSANSTTKIVEIDKIPVIYDKDIFDYEERIFDVFPKAENGFYYFNSNGLIPKQIIKLENDGTFSSPNFF